MLSPKAGRCASHTWLPRYQAALRCLLVVVAVVLARQLGCCWLTPAANTPQEPDLHLEGDAGGGSAVCTDVMCEGSNSVGRWRWKPRGRHIADMLVVIGGEPRVTGAVNTLLVEQGYKVWTTAQPCNKKLTRLCHESLGYIDYMADPDPRKPIARSVAFIHGHMHAWHQGGRNISELLARGLRCGRRSRRYQSLHPEMHAPAVLRHTPFWSGITQKYISLLDPAKVLPRRASFPISAQFVIPGGFVRDNQTFFGEALPLVRQGNTSAFFWEAMWHVALGREPSIDVYRMVPECMPPNDVLEDSAYERHVRDTLRGTVTIDRYMQEMRTENTGPEWHAGVLVVVGLELGTGEGTRTAHPALVRKVQALGYNVWLRHPESSGCKVAEGDGQGTGCYGDLGYLVYLARERPQQKVVVFLRGDEALSFVDRLPEAVECARAGRAYVALETGMTQDHYNTQVAHLTSHHSLDLPRLAKIFSKYETTFFPILRNLPEGTASNVWPPVAVQEEDVFEARLGSHFAVSQDLINRAPLDHYGMLRDRYESLFGSRKDSEEKKRDAFAFVWHLVFGGTAKHPSPYGTKLCVVQTLRPFQASKS